MDDFLLKALAFIVAIGLLVTVHEFGHFWVARRLGIRVLRFSIGFGRPLWRRQTAPDQPEYVIAAIPLGGYVKMLDEHEGPVADAERHRAFNRQSIPVRTAVVVAGPLFNLLFAVVAFWGVFILGETGIRPLVGDVEPDSPAAQAGLTGGDEILAVNETRTPTWSLALQEIATESVAGQVLRIAVVGENGLRRELAVDSSAVGDLSQRSDLMAHLGIRPDRPDIPPVIGKLVAGEAAEQAGLREGDRILVADGEAIADWSEWVAYVQARPGETIDLVVERDGLEHRIALTPAPLTREDEVIGRIGASNFPVPGLAERYRAEYRLGPLEAIPVAIGKTWEYSILTLKVIWRILTGQASIHNLSGPITIADAAGKTASIGFVYFVKFLAIVSISLGVLNLLPIPVLDGGHLVYFAIEAVKGSPLSEAAMLQAQKVGLMLLLSLMTVAFYVDFVRLFT